MPTKRARTLEERTHGLRSLVAVLAMLDTGLRMGEVAGLTWGQVRWGESADDPRRAIVIDRSRARGLEEGPPKSGRTRTVALSRRLRGALERLYRAQWQPGCDELPQHAPKDLRDTFTSSLLSLGVQLGYVSRQLGHADVAVTARHCTEWVDGDDYRDLMPLRPGEVPADLLTRVVEVAEDTASQQQSPHSSPIYT